MAGDERDLAALLAATAHEIAGPDQPADVQETVVACIADAVINAAESAALPAVGRLARALITSPGGIDSCLGVRGGTEQVVTAHAFLVHARLRDDSYRTAFHPGQIVVPTALALAQECSASGRRTLDAVLVGYEVACALAELMLPASAQRGWRITALLSPIAAAATAAALLAPGDTEALASSLRLAAGLMGGSLHTVRDGGDWQMQPALLATSGVAAARLAAAGHLGMRGALEAPTGAIEQFCGSKETTIAAQSRIRDIEFKQYRAPMFFQAALRACDEVDARLTTGGVAGEPLVRRVTLNVTAFSAGYAGADKPGSSVADVRRTVLDHVVQELHWKLADDLVWDVRPLPDGSARGGSLDVELAGGHVEKADLVTTKANDTREVRRIHGSSHAVEGVLRGAEELPGKSGVEAINKAWQDLVSAELSR